MFSTFCTCLARSCLLNQARMAVRSLDRACSCSPRALSVVTTPMAASLRAGVSQGKVAGVERSGGAPEREAADKEVFPHEVGLLSARACEEVGVGERHGGHHEELGDHCRVRACRNGRGAVRKLHERVGLGGALRGRQQRGGLVRGA